MMLTSTDLKRLEAHVDKALRMSEPFLELYLAEVHDNAPELEDAYRAIASAHKDDVLSDEERAWLSEKGISGRYAEKDGHWRRWALSQGARTCCKSDPLQTVWLANRMEEVFPGTEKQNAAVKALLRLERGTQDVAARCALVSALAACGTTRAFAYIETLFSSPDTPVAVKERILSLWTQRPAYENTIVEIARIGPLALQKSALTAVRVRLEGIHSIPLSHLQEIISRGLVSSDPDTRIEAAKLLAVSRQANFLARLKEIVIHDPDYDVQRATLSVIACLPPMESVPQLLDLSVSEAGPTLRSAANDLRLLRNEGEMPESCTIQAAPASASALDRSLSGSTESWLDRELREFEEEER